jgi:regulatory factor X
MMQHAIPIDFAHVAPGPHSRSASVSSSSSHSLSRPQSSHSGPVHRLGALGPSPDDLFRATLQLNAEHVRASSGQSLSSAYSDLNTPGESPPGALGGNGTPLLKNALRPSHIRARQAASPYHRAADDPGLYSSSSDTEDAGMYLHNPQELYPMYGNPTGMAPSVSPESAAAAGAFGRMNLGPDQNLEKLAANVRAATTTSAADRAKQIFVQAWSVSLSRFAPPPPFC